MRLRPRRAIPTPDGYGNPCDGDFNQDFAINATDFGMFFVPAFKGLDPAPWPQGIDMDCNGFVSATDFGMFFVPKFKNLPAGIQQARSVRARVCGVAGLPVA